MIILLDMTIRPINYNLTFEPDLKNFTFKGWEILNFKTQENIREIILDAADLKIVDCELLIAKKNLIKSYRAIEKEEKLIILLKEELKRGKFQLYLEFEGVLNDNLVGFYRSKYTTDGKEKYLATTQFEAADSRRAFPCIDNPAYKATFNVNLIIDENLISISNTLPKRIKKYHFKAVAKPYLTSGVQDSVRVGQNEKKIVFFETTPLMSTYLLYLGVGKFEFLQDKYRDVILRIVTTPGKSKFGRFALKCAKKFLKYYEEYFDNPYPLKKLDLIAVPDFASGAMENWGAITFRENALLFYPEKSSKATMQRIAEIIAHELVHQWFGNLVTMKWWDDLWLNESFATYMANKALNHFWPEWSIWPQYVADTVYEGMALDSLKSSHPIKVNVKNTNELDELFDEIAYSKGGSILRMLDLYLGEKSFREGLRDYIKRFLYLNAEAKDLWSSLKSVSDKPVVKIMQSFINQVGFPKVKVELRNNVIDLEQSRFLFEKGDADLKQKWIIPYHLGNGRGLDGTNLLDKKEMKIETTGDIEYINLNKNYSNFFITDYAKDLLRKLGQNIQFLNDQEKLGMIHDLFALILTGKKNLSELYQYIDIYYAGEKSSVVLHYLIAKLTRINLLAGDDISRKLATLLSNRALGKVGYEPQKSEAVVDTYLRSTALSSLSLFEDNDAKEFINKKFTQYLKEERSLHSDLRAVVYSSSVSFSDENYSIIKNFYMDSEVQEEKVKMLMALGYTRNKKLIKAALKFSLDKEVPFAFLPYAISSIAKNPQAKEIAISWFVETWPLLLQRAGGLANMLLRRILQVIVPICGVGREKEVEVLLSKNTPQGLARSIDQALETLRVNSRFANKNKMSN